MSIIDTGVIEIFGTRYYTYGTGLLFVLPFALWFFYSLFRALFTKERYEAKKWAKPIISGWCTALVFIAAFWDVFAIGQEVTKLCNEKGGIHVYRTAQAEGFLGAAGITGWDEYGFQFTESEGRKGKVRYFMKNGEPSHEYVDEFHSQYELVIQRPIISPRIQMHLYQVVERKTNEILGEVYMYGVDAGRIDMLFHNLTGFSYSPWMCTGSNLANKSPINIVKYVLRPAK